MANHLPTYSALRNMWMTLFKLSDWCSDWLWQTALFQYLILKYTIMISTKGFPPIHKRSIVIGWNSTYVLFYSTWNQNSTRSLWLVETICMSFLFHKESKFNLIGIYENEALLQPEIIYSLNQVLYFIASYFGSLSLLRGGGEKSFSYSSVLFLRPSRE